MNEKLFVTRLHIVIAFIAGIPISSNKQVKYKADNRKESDAHLLAFNGCWTEKGQKDKLAIRINTISLVNLRDNCYA